MQTKVWTTADLSRGRAPCDPPEWKSCKELLQDHRPLTSLWPLGGRPETFLITSWVLMRFGTSCLAPLRVELQTVEPFTWGLDSGVLYRGLLQLTLPLSGPFRLGVVLCGVWDKDRAELVLLAITLFTVYVSVKSPNLRVALWIFTIESVRPCPVCVLDKRARNKPRHM